MDRIILEVDDNAARNWQHISKEEQVGFSNAISRALNSVVDNSDEDFSDFLERFGRKAEANGLTENVLNKLLNEE
ncbi:hypothetical protein [Mucilaginibacter pedocola]|uniref:Uncharacterized protein n=1 Tax=Mucilaginibacter pedocola TaxID=1792845 RepID=A0A1S9PI76_9SPHI|nr:hypothetical protein [Mucilaginibacter pedocola]OOQ60653.1 hypothetical protein BC343_23950 [Mucilaginibacter pedocola]